MALQTWEEQEGNQQRFLEYLVRLEAGRKGTVPTKPISRPLLKILCVVIWIASLALLFAPLIWLVIR